MADEQKLPIRILSIEDDEFIRLFIKDVMWIHGANENIQFDTVSNTEAGLVRIKDPATRPHILFLDLMLPEKDGGSPDIENGMGVLEKVKTDPDLMSIKVLVFSSLKEAEVKEKVMRLGADRYMVKGEYLPAELIATVKEIMQQVDRSSNSQ